MKTDEKCCLVTEKMHIKNVIWDWNGTMLDDVEYAVDIMNGILDKYRLPLIDIQQYRDIFDFPVRDYYVKLGFDFSKLSFEEVGMEFINAFYANSRGCRLRQGCASTIRELHARGYRQWLLSAAETGAITRLLEHFELLDYFDKVIGIDNHFAAGKIELGRKWLKSSGINPATVIMIGDTVHDFEVTRQMNIPVILLADGHNSRSRLEKCGRQVINHLEQLIPYLDKEN
ncbi:HAD family hydrolase [Planctomycetota bacterium]